MAKLRYKKLSLPAGVEAVKPATMVAFTEGPATDAAGNLFFSDIINNRIMKLTPDGVRSVFVSDSPTLLDGEADTNGVADVFVREPVSGRRLADFFPDGQLDDSVLEVLTTPAPFRGRFLPEGSGDHKVGFGVKIPEGVDEIEIDHGDGWGRG